MSEVAKAVKPLFDKFIDFFDIFDLSFFVSGATFVAAVAWAGLTPDLAQLIGFAPLDSGAWLIPGQVPTISAAILVLASYVSGMTCFALGRWIRSWLYRVLHWIRGVPRRKQTMLFDELEQHGVLERLEDGVSFRVRPEFDRLPWLKRYFIRGGAGQESALYVRMWAEVRQLGRFAPSFSLVRRYWVSSATLDGLFVAFVTWAVMLRLESTHIHGWIPSIATFIGALFCLREAQRYGEYQREELVATMLHAYDLPDAELGTMLGMRLPGTEAAVETELVLAVEVDAGEAAEAASAATASEASAEAAAEDESAEPDANADA